MTIHHCHGCGRRRDVEPWNPKPVCEKCCRAMCRCGDPPSDPAKGTLPEGLFGPVRNYLTEG